MVSKGPLSRPFSNLNRALFWTRTVMVWERLLPALFPFVLLVLLVAVAAQWGLFLNLPPLAHAGILAAGLAVAIFACVRAVMRFRQPTFTEVNTRLAIDNGLKPERLLAMRHELDQPKLKIGKAKAGIAVSDPFALRFIALMGALIGLLIMGPVPASRIVQGFCPFGKTATQMTAQVAEK
jgi:hypothetical protein